MHTPSGTRLQARASSGTFSPCACVHPSHVFLLVPCLLCQCETSGPTALYDWVMEAVLSSMGFSRWNLRVEGGWRWLLTEFRKQYSVPLCYANLRYKRVLYITVQYCTALCGVLLYATLLCQPLVQTSSVVKPLHSPVYYCTALYSTVPYHTCPRKVPPPYDGKECDTVLLLSCYFPWQVLAPRDGSGHPNQGLPGAYLRAPVSHHQCQGSRPPGQPAVQAGGEKDQSSTVEYRAVQDPIVQYSTLQVRMISPLQHFSVWQPADHQFSQLLQKEAKPKVAVAPRYSTVLYSAVLYCSAALFGYCRRGCSWKWRRACRSY